MIKESKKAIAELNILSSNETTKEKREKYKECINVLLKDIEVLEILEKHPLLDLSNLYEYDPSEFDDYWEDWSSTTNDLDENEFKTLKQWQDNLKKGGNK